MKRLSYLEINAIAERATTAGDSTYAACESAILETVERLNVPENAGLSDVLDEIDEFLQGQEDVLDGDDGRPRPNRAMQLLMDLRCERGRASATHSPTKE